MKKKKKKHNYFEGSRGVEKLQLFSPLHYPARFERLVPGEQGKTRDAKNKYKRA
jgi:hypothetical protein